MRPIFHNLKNRPIRPGLNAVSWFVLQINDCYNPRMRCLRLSVLASLALGVVSAFACEAPKPGLPTLSEVLAAKHDLWGEAAMRQPNGASYEFFKDLLPPPRYVHADFRYYPIVLSAPNARVKARLISDGSGLNLPGGARSWNAVGTAVMFRVGADEFKFGGIADRLGQPTLAEGYLPIPAIRYWHASEKYELEAFAVTEAADASNCTVAVRFSLAGGNEGIVTIQPLQSPVRFTNHQILDESGNVLVFLDSSWTWERQRAHAKISRTQSATAEVFTKPIPAEGNAARDGFSQTHYAELRAECATRWKSLFSNAMHLETPEPLVNNAWRNLIIQNFGLINGDRMNYSAGNQYEKMYAAESSDAALPLLWWGYPNDFRRLLPVILDIQDKRLPHHFASHKLNDICRFYWQTRDAEFIKSLRPRWQKDLDLLLTDRSPENGLLTKENYCTDIEVPVYPLTANSTSWAALRDLAPVLEELGDNATAKRVRTSAAEFKQALLRAVEKNQRMDTDPPFIPMALFYGEDTHDPITHSRLGSYWDLVVNYVIGSRLFAGSDRELWLPRYLETHGGLIMGLTRSAATNNTFWTGTHRTNPLYGMRYILDTLRRDDPERALVSFYGMLAHGMTRNTFIGAEGCAVEPLDEGGRFFYCPPNSSSNGQWLAVLRYLLVQDWDEDEDGRPDTLRLCFATPRRWLEDGKNILVENAPTDFGPVSVTMESKLRSGEVVANVSLPARNTPKRILLRARVPEGRKVVSATVGNEKRAVDDRGTVDLSDLRGQQHVVFHVQSL